MVSEETFAQHTPKFGDRDGQCPLPFGKSHETSYFELKQSRVMQVSDRAQNPTRTKDEKFRTVPEGQGFQRSQPACGEIQNRRDRQSSRAQGTAPASLPL